LFQQFVEAHRSTEVIELSGQFHANVMREIKNLSVIPVRDEVSFTELISRLSLLTSISAVMLLVYTAIIDFDPVRNIVTAVVLL
jgi:hypothetical protein